MGVRVVPYRIVQGLSTPAGYSRPVWSTTPSVRRTLFFFQAPPPSIRGAFFRSGMGTRFSLRLACFHDERRCPSASPLPILRVCKGRPPPIPSPESSDREPPPVGPFRLTPLNRLQQRDEAAPNLHLEESQPFSLDFASSDVSLPPC